jgi:glyoxylase-like metal-dependent hydrolase (beta-lactamase superfamily II)
VEGEDCRSSHYEKDLAGFIDVDRTFAEDEQLRLEGSLDGLFAFITFPDTRASTFVCSRRARVLITGDLMAGIGTIVIDPPEGKRPFFDSLRRMQALPVRALFPAHGQ